MLKIYKKHKIQYIFKILMESNYNALDGYVISSYPIF